MIADRVEALVIARIHASAKPPRANAIAAALARYAPLTSTEVAWRDRVEQAIADLRAAGTLDDGLGLVARDALAQRIGRHAARTWRQLASKILPGLGLGCAPDDKALSQLTGRDGWAAAIAARVLGLWTTGMAPSVNAVCDAYAWRELALPGRPKRCPPEVRAVFVQRALGVEPGPPDRMIRLFAANAIGAPRPELGVMHDALVRAWCAGTPLGAGRGTFTGDVREVVAAARDGVFGDRKVFIAAVWRALRGRSRWQTLALDDFKARLVAGHRAGELALARADHVAATDPELVAASETVADGASFHFVVREAS